MTPTVYVPTYQGLCQCQEWDETELAELRASPREWIGSRGMVRMSILKRQIRERGEKLDRLATVAMAVIANQPVSISSGPSVTDDDRPF